MKLILPLLFVFFCSVGLASADEPVISTSGGQRPNVLLIMTDDQGYGDLACHGNPIIKTPHLDKLYSESLRFTNFHVNPFCSPTRAALMTGRMSDRTHVRATVYSRNHLNRRETTMAEFFKASGYRTGHFGKWHLGRNYPYRPIDRGFDEWVGHGDGGTGTSSDYWGNDKMNDTYSRNSALEKFSGFCTDIYFDEAMTFIKQSKEKPFFVYLATNVPHGPWNVPKQWRTPYQGKVSDKTADFYATISRFDKNLGRLRAFLADEGLAENTIVIYLTDNGSSGGGWQVFNASMRGHKSSVYEGGHRVPCFIHWPAKGFKEPKDIAALTHHFDLLPTLIEACSLSVPRRGHLRFDGRSLVPLWKNPNAEWADRTTFLHQQNIRETPARYFNALVMTQRWRLINGRALYDIKADPSQKNDVAKQHPDVVTELKKRYEQYWNQINLAANPYPRPIIGTEHEKETPLYPDGWIRDKERPNTWDQSHVRSALNNSGFWPVEIANEGVYQFEVRRWPKEIDHPITAPLPPDTTSDIDVLGCPLRSSPGVAIPAVKVELVIGDTKLEKNLRPDETNVTFKRSLPAGPTRVRAWLVDSKGEKRGAYYIYVRAE